MRLHIPKSAIEINVDHLPPNVWTIGQVTRAVVAALPVPLRWAPPRCHAYNMPDGREMVVAMDKGQTLEQALRTPAKAK